jgi:hypothetical protein
LTCWLVIRKDDTGFGDSLRETLLRPDELVLFMGFSSKAVGIPPVPFGID